MGNVTPKGPSYFFQSKDESNNQAKTMVTDEIKTSESFEAVISH